MLVQDNRRWGQSFSLRLELTSTIKRGETASLAFQLGTPDHLELDFDRPVTIQRGAEWVPLEGGLEIVPGSALDFSTVLHRHPAIGASDRIIARADGQFADRQDSATALRFYGVNLCFSAQYLSHDEADQLGDRLTRLGYNAVRIHHYEDGLTLGRPGFAFDPEALDRLDYLLAGLGKRGIYITTDLFVSRTIHGSDLGLAEGLPINFKILVPVYPAAFENWKAFTRALLEHRNAYNMRRYGDDPTLAWLSMINEGNFENYYGDILRLPGWSAAFAHWLQERYADRSALQSAWGIELTAGEDAAQGSIALPKDCNDGSRRSRDMLQFLSITEHEMFTRMAGFIRKDLGCAALLTNTNAWTNRLTGQLARCDYDYVDDHFYVDHPAFLEHPWQLPSRSSNANPLSHGALGGSSSCFVRLWDKPFTITEYDYCAPGSYRGMGGLLTGALAALQGWAGIWHFAYSHAEQAEFGIARMDYFNLASDPLSQAADRAALALFVRGDLHPAVHRVALTMKGVELDEPASANPHLAPSWDDLAWTTGMGSLVVRGPKPAPAFDLTFAVARSGTPEPGAVDPYAHGSDAVLDALRGAGIAPAISGPPAERTLRSDTGELAIDTAAGTLVIDTPRTAGGYAEGGGAIQARRAGVAISALSTGATVFVIALDDQPIARSRHLLVTHLTDVQNSGMRFAESARRTLLDWGGLPYLAAAGTAHVEITLDQPGTLAVWGLTTTGKRTAEVPAEVLAGRLAFQADVACPSGARLLYEIAPR